MRKFHYKNPSAKNAVSSALFGLAILLGIGMFPSKAKSQVKLDAEGHQWWQHAVFYEIYPRSFADSSNNGIGDLNGITAKLDYLKDLGIDAKRRNIRVIMDFVMNHTSDQHAWFKESKSSKDNPKRDWFIWRDGKGPNEPPNNWLSTFGGSAWKFDPTTGQWYYHFFYPEQPDLNWRNPEVEKAMFDVTRWWYQRGVSGFRLDAVDTLFEDPDLRDNPILPGTNKYGDPNMQDKYN